MEKTFTRIGNVVANQPNWASPVSEEFSFLTAITEARDGTEKRDALRQTPRVELQYSSDQVRQAHRRLFYDMNRFEDSGRWIVPVRWRNVRLDGDALLGDIAIVINRDAPWWLQPGSSLVLENDTTQEAVAVASVSGRTITLSAPLQTAFGSSCLVMLAHLARYDEDNSLVSLTDQHRQTVSRFTVDPGSTPVWPTAIIDPVVHEGYPTFTWRPNWKAKLTTKINDQRETVDSDRGVIDVTRFRKAALYDYSMQFMAINQSAADDLIGWFIHNMGRRGHFWMPTLMDDLDPMVDEAAGSTSLTVPGSDFHRAFADDDTLTTVMVRFPDGCVQFNRIDSTDFVDGNTVLTLHDRWTRPVTTDLMVSFAFLVRFRDDTLVVQWRSAQVAEMTIAFRPVPNAWVPQPVLHSYFGWPQLYGNNSSDPVTNPSKWLKIDLYKEGVPLAAIDRGECFLRHAQSGYSDGLIPGITIYGHVAFYDENNAVINTNSLGSFDFYRASGDDGTETENYAEYNSGYIPIPATRTDDPSNVDHTFSRPVRYIYLRSSMVYSPVLGGPRDFAHTVEILAPDWGYYNQVGDVACP